MIKEAYGYGDSVEEAKEKALLELNAAQDDDIQYEVIDMPKPKVLGMFGGKQAKVRVYIELPDEKPTRVKKKNSEKGAKAKPAKPEKSKPVKREQTATSNVYADAVNASEIDENSPAGRAVKYLTNIAQHLGCTDLEVKVALKENGAMLILSGNGLGVIIGRRGETLDSLQYLTSLAANNGGGYFKVSINIGNYREKREQTLTTLAKRVSAQVVSTSRSRTLEPMNPYERRIIHTAVQEIEGVTSSSIGEGSSRRVVISPVGNTKKQTEATIAREPKKDAASAPLYGKIN